jgi:hypothetical protein
MARRLDAIVLVVGAIGVSGEVHAHVQCKTQTDQIRSYQNRLTLCEDKVVLLDKSLERVLVKLLDVGSSNGSRKESSADGRVLHGEVCVCGW